MDDKHTMPISITEKMIERHYSRAGGETVSDGVIDDLHDAARLARECGERALVSHGKIMANVMRTPLANARESRENAFKNFSIASQKIDMARAKAEAAIEQIRQSTNAPSPPKDAASAFERAEIRNVLSQMPPEKRSAAIAEAISSDDEDVVLAILTGPTLLTNLGKSEREAIRHDWRRRRFPKELDRMSRLKAALTDLERAQALLLNFVNGMTDGDEIKRAEDAEKAASQAKVA